MFAFTDNLQNELHLNWFKFMTFVLLAGIVSLWVFFSIFTDSNFYVNFCGFKKIFGICWYLECKNIF